MLRGRNRILIKFQVVEELDSLQRLDFIEWINSIASQLEKAQLGVLGKHAKTRTYFIKGELDFETLVQQREIDHALEPGVVEGEQLNIFKFLDELPVALRQLLAPDALDY